MSRFPKHVSSTAINYLGKKERKKLNIGNKNIPIVVSNIDKVVTKLAGQKSYNVITKRNNIYIMIPRVAGGVASYVFTSWCNNNESSPH